MENLLTLVSVFVGIAVMFWSIIAVVLYKKYKSQIGEMFNLNENESVVTVVKIDELICSHKKLTQRIKNLQTEIANVQNSNQSQSAVVCNAVNDAMYNIRMQIEDINQKVDTADIYLKSLAPIISGYKTDTIEICNKFNADTTEKLETIQADFEALVKLIEIYQADNAKLRKQLEFYTEIKSDSANLNEQISEDEDNLLIEKLLQKISNDSVQGSNTTALIPQNFKENTLNHEYVNSNEMKISNDGRSLMLDDDILDTEQKAAFELMQNTNENILITGKAGTGKSFLLKLFAKQPCKPTIVLAPTGIAAMNIQGATIHSAFGYNNLNNLSLEDINENNIKLKSEKIQVLKQVEVIIIDEISMVRSDTLEKMNKILQVFNHSDELFGGKQIILFGDLFQLPPIANSEEVKYLQNTFGGIYFFNSNAFIKGKFKFVELTINHRQKDDTAYFEVLNRIRLGQVLPDDLNLLNTRFCKNQDEIRRVIRLFPTKSDAEQVNKKELAKIPGKEYVYQSKLISNVSNMTINIDKAFPVTEALKLKLGALVMMVANDVDKKWVNGTLGIVSALGDDLIKVTIDGFEHEIHPAMFTQEEAIYKEGKISYETICEVWQYPVVLAYAITIHKSQGMTYKKLACNIEDCFSPGQAYVALSRCSSLEGLHLLKPVNVNIISAEMDVKDFYCKQQGLGQCDLQCL